MQNIIMSDHRSLSALQRIFLQLRMNFLRQLCFSLSNPALQHSSTTRSFSSSSMFHPARQAHSGCALLLQLLQGQVQTVELQVEMVQTSSCGSRVAKLLDLNSRLPFSSLHSPLISMQKMWIDTPSRTDLAGSDSSPRLEQNWHSMALPLTCGLFLSEHGSQRPSEVAEQQNLWKRTWQSVQQEKGLYCSWWGLRQPPQAVLSTPLGFLRVFLLFLRFMYSSNSRLSVMVRSWSASMLPYCSSVSRLAKQFRKSISQLASASLRFLRIRHAMYLSSTDSTVCKALGGSLRMRAYTFCTSALILTLFCFMRNSRKAISVAISESCCLLPLISLKARWRSCRLVMKLCRLLMRQASSSDTSIILASSPPSNTARKCFSAPSTSTSVCASDCSSRISSTQRQSSSKGTFPAGSTSVGVSMTSLREGTSSSSMAARSSFSCWSMWRLQQVSISSRQNFSRRICFCTSFSKTPNCGERRRDEKMDYFFSRGAGSLGRLRGLGLLRMGCVRLAEWRDSDYSPELFYSPSRFSKDIQNYYQPHQLPPPHLPAFAPLIYYLMGRAAKKEKTPSEHSEEEQEDQDYDEEDEDAILQGHPEDELDENQRNEELLAAIQQKAAECPENEELSWNAIYSLKKEEAALSAAMAEELEAIREKYELLKQPIYKLISNVALGNKVDAKLYRPEGLPCRGDPSKVQPIAIPNFWAQVFDKEGLISHNVDVECLGKLKEFSCQLIEPKTNHIRILMKFKAATEYFSNLELQVDTHHDPTTNEPTREIKQDIKYKKDREESSIFTILFDPKTAVQETYNYCSELYQDYTNAIYFYFREEEDYENGEGEDDEEGEEEEEEDSEEVEAVKKPTKKSKGEQPKKELEKPECKQQ